MELVQRNESNKTYHLAKFISVQIAVNDLVCCFSLNINIPGAHMNGYRWKKREQCYEIIYVQICWIYNDTIYVNKNKK